LEKVKDIWETLCVSHEGTKAMRKAKIEMLEGQLDRCVMLDDETPQEMYNLLKILINNVRAYGSKRWNDRNVVKRVIRAYAVRDMTLCSLISENPGYKMMTQMMCLEGLMFQEEANNVNNLFKGISSSKKQDITLKERRRARASKWLKKVLVNIMIIVTMRVLTPTPKKLFYPLEDLRIS
jgi:hypothetical protein